MAIWWLLRRMWRHSSSCCLVSLTVSISFSESRDWRLDKRCLSSRGGRRASLEIFVLLTTPCGLFAFVRCPNFSSSRLRVSSVCVCGPLSASCCYIVCFFSQASDTDQTPLCGRRRCETRSRRSERRRNDARHVDQRSSRAKSERTSCGRSLGFGGARAS